MAAASHATYESARTTTIVVILIIALLTVGIGYYFYRLPGCIPAGIAWRYDC